MSTFPLGRPLVEYYIEYYLKVCDIQTVAMIVSVLFEEKHNKQTEKSEQNLEENLADGSGNGRKVSSGCSKYGRVEISIGASYDEIDQNEEQFPPDLQFETSFENNAL